MDDLISRQAAIEALQNHYEVRNPKQNAIMDECVMLISNVPSAQPEQKTGKWIDCMEDGYVECPFCHSATNCEGDKDELHYCFSCGAELR